MPSKIDFYRLPRPVQERFAAATRGSAPPGPILFRRAPRTRAWAYLTGSAVLLIAASIVLWLGWGDVSSPLAIHGPAMLSVDAALLVAASYSVLHAIGILLTLESLPYRPGTYLFPACAVDARGPTLVVWSVADAQSVERTTAPPGLLLRMRDGSPVRVRASGLAEAERAEGSLEPLRRELARAIAGDEPHVLSELDPLHDRAMSSPIGPKERMKPQLAGWIRFDWAIALVVGVALGRGLGATRNALSDDAMFRAVVKSSTAPAYRRYLLREGNHGAEVRDVLLPRAELREAEEKGTPDAVLAFARASAPSKIAGEIDTAIRRAMLGALGNAKAAGTLAALDAFAKKFPAGYVDSELRAARHAVYAKALGAWAEQAHPDSPTRAFFERLFAWAEAHGPEAAIRFRLSPTSMEDADRSVKKSGHYPGPDALPSTYVTPEALRPREERVGAALADRFTEAFPAEILSVRAGEPLAADAPALTIPTLVVDYAPEWSRANTACPKPDTVFAGLIFNFNVGFFLPEGPPMKLVVKAWRGAEIWKLKADHLPREEFEQKVYGTMIDASFDQLAKKLNDTLF